MSVPARRRRRQHGPPAELGTRTKAVSASHELGAGDGSASHELGAGDGSASLTTGSPSAIITAGAFITTGTGLAAGTAADVQ
jgi:hypothetical protein